VHLSLSAFQLALSLSWHGIQANRRRGSARGQSS
jgi:hypothetical protein